MKHLTKPDDPKVAEIMDKIPHDVLESLDGKLKALELALVSADPLMPNHLRESHRLLITYPETVHLLDDHEIKAIVAGSERHTNIKIVTSPAKKTGGTRKKVTVDDL
jgi:hypothetical protein